MPEGDAYLGRGVPGGCLEILGPNTAPRFSEAGREPAVGQASVCILFLGKISPLLLYQVNFQYQLL